MKLNLKKSVGQVPGLVVGGVAANYVGKLIPIENETVKSAAPLVLGILLLGQKGMLASVGAGMVSAGGANLAKSFGIGDDTSLDGYEDFNIDGTDDEEMSGVINDSPINGDYLEDDLD